MLKFSHVTPPSLTIAVLSGGDSSEREISLKTGRAIDSALTSLGHRCTVVDPSATDLESLNWLDFDVAAIGLHGQFGDCLLYTSPSPRDQRGSRMPSSA